MKVNVEGNRKRIITNKLIFKIKENGNKNFYK